MEESFLKMAGFRCRFAKELGDVRGAAEWGNDAMRWFLEDVECQRVNEVLLRAAVGFADDVRGNAKALLEGGLDERILESFLTVLKGSDKR